MLLVSDIIIAGFIAFIVLSGAGIYAVVKYSEGIDGILKILNAEVIGDNHYLTRKVHGLAEKAGIEKPRVGIADTDVVNAFAVGSLDSNAVIVTTGALQTFTDSELEAVIGHEIGHIANGDSLAKQSMVYAITGVMYAVLLPVYAIQILLTLIVPGMRPAFSGMTGVLETIAQYTFSIVGTIVLNTFSRKREYAADSYGAKLTSKEQTISVLTKLGELNPDTSDPLVSALSSKKINATHPSIQDRIRALQ